MVIHKQTDLFLDNKIQLTPHQEEIVEKSLHILRNNNLVYISAEERVGKTYAALDIVNKLDKKYKIHNIYVVTKKKALEGWESSLDNYFKKGLSRSWILVNYESLHKIPVKKFTSKNTSVFEKPDLVIVDEAHHALSSYPKPSRAAKLLQAIAYNAPVIFLSATPCAQSYSQLFHQLNITKFSPWDSYRNFYEWARWYVIPETKYITGRQIAVYDKVRKAAITPVLEEYFVSYSRKQANFEFEPEDEIHWISQPDELKEITRKVKNDSFVNLKVRGLSHFIEINNSSKELKILHQLEGGTLKIDASTSINLPYIEKINFIKETFGDHEDIAIFYEYRQEQKLLQEHFKHSLILQGSTFAEGIDLSHIKHLIVYSMNFSAAKYAQRRARQCRIDRKEPIKVHYLLSKGFISEDVYDCVANKHENFTASIYERNRNERKSVADDLKEV